jgi:multidrug efflux pump subunit AcrB
MIGAALVIYRFLYLALMVLFESEKFIFTIGFTLLFGGMTGVVVALLVARYGKRATDD